MRQNFIKLRLASAAFLLLSVLFSGCAHIEKPDFKNNILNHENTLIVGTDSDPHSLLPFENASHQFERIANCCYEMLVRTNLDGTVSPWVAKSWKATAGGMYFYINKGINFQDGTPCDAEAVAWNMRKWGRYDAVTASTPCSWDKACAVDEYTVFLPYEEYHNEILINMGCANFMLVSPTAYEADAESLKMNPVGTGPFRVAEYKQDDHILLERFDGYWKPQDVHLDYIEFKFINSQTEQFNALESGRIDVACDISYEDLGRCSLNDELDVWYFQPCVVDSLWFNCINDTFKDERVRKACAYAINLKEIWQKAYYGLSQVCFGPATSDTYGYDPSYDFENWPYEWDDSDYIKCQELLEEAGYPDGLDVTLRIDRSDARTKVAEIIAEQLTACNIRTTVISDEYSATQANIFSGNFEMALNGSATNGTVAKTLYERYSAALAYPGSFSFSKWDEPRVDELLRKASKAINKERMLGYYKEIAKLYTEEVPAIAYWERLNCCVSSKRVKGVKVLVEPVNLSNVYFKK